jgi:hypothetical protein
MSAKLIIAGSVGLSLLVLSAYLCGLCPPWLMAAGVATPPLVAGVFLLTSHDSPLTIGTISAIRAALWLVPSLVRRPTRRVAERYRELRDAIALAIGIKAAEAGAMEYVAELYDLKETR